MFFQLLAFSVCSNLQLCFNPEYAAGKLIHPVFKSVYSLYEITRDGSWTWTLSWREWREGRELWGSNWNKQALANIDKWTGQIVCLHDCLNGCAKSACN